MLHWKSDSNPEAGLIHRAGCNNWRITGSNIGENGAHTIVFVQDLNSFSPAYYCSCFRQSRKFEEQLCFVLIVLAEKFLLRFAVARHPLIEYFRSSQLIR